MRNKKASIILAAVIAAAVLSAALSVLALPKGDKLVPGLKVGGIKVGKMTASQAGELLLSSLGTSPDGEVTVSMDGAEKSINLADADMAFNFKETVEKAYGIGRTGGMFAKIADSFKARLGMTNLPVSIECDEEKLESSVSETLADMGTPVLEYTYEIEEDAVKITNGKPGDIPDSKAVAYDVINAAGLGKNVPVLKYKKAERVPKDVDVDELYKKLYGEVKDAEYVIEDGKVTVSDHKIGVEFDKTTAKKLAAENKEYGSAYKIPAKVTMPKLLSEDAKERIFADVLGKYSTRYNAGDTSRSHNIALATSSINGVVLAPGDVFSYNGVVGERTAERGYKNAKVFMNGESVDGIGGGICQVSTTLYSAALYANLEMVERANHQLPVSYVPLGQDATVFYGSIDFKFKNSTNYPIKIVASANGGVMYVEIQGYKEDKSLKVTIENTTVSVTEPKIKEIEDDTLPEGETKVQKKGAPGAVVDTYKTVTRDGADPVRVRISRSAYSATAEEVLVGTGKAVGVDAGENPEEEETEEVAEEATGEPNISSEPNITAGASTILND